MSFDLAAALRTLKPQKRRARLKRRARADLHWVENTVPIGEPVLLDTTVYIDVLQGYSPPPLDLLLSIRVCNHSAVCLAELTHLFGRLDPENAGTKSALREIEATIDDIPGHRLSAPDEEIWGVAGMLAGMLFRLGGYKAGQEKECLNDALIYLHSLKIGSSVVTRNVKDFDLLNQLVPLGKVIFYERV